MQFPFLAAFIIFVLFLAFRFATLNRRREEKIHQFWAKEEQAKHTPTKDISTLNYISIPISSFPFGKYDDDEIILLEDQLSALSKQKIYNLTGKTNTELQLEYGTDNLQVMSDIGENFNQMAILLTDYGKALMQKGDYESAAKVFEFGAAVKSDVSSNYTLLGDCYVALHQERKIKTIKEQVEPLHLLLEHKIFTYLDSLIPDTENFELNSHTSGEPD